MVSIHTRFAAAIVAVGLTFGSVFVVAAPAAAHDDLISSDPGEGESLLDEDSTSVYCKD